MANEAATAGWSLALHSRACAQDEPQTRIASALLIAPEKVRGGKYYRLVLRLAETSGPTILPCNHNRLRQNSRFCCLKSGSSFSKLSSRCAQARKAAASSRCSTAIRILAQHPIPLEYSPFVHPHQEFCTHASGAGDNYLTRCSTAHVEHEFGRAGFRCRKGTAPEQPAPSGGSTLLESSLRNERPPLRLPTEGRPAAPRRLRPTQDVADREGKADRKTSCLRNYLSSLLGPVCVPLLIRPCRRSGTDRFC